MKKISIDIEFEKYDKNFGRMTCHAHTYVFDNDPYALEGDEGFKSEENINRVVTFLNKMFSNKNYFNTCATFSYRDTTTESFGMEHNTGRIFGFGGDSYDTVKWDVTGDVRATVKSITKKVIMDMYKDCVDKCNNPTYCVRGA